MPIALAIPFVAPTERQQHLDFVAILDGCYVLRPTAATIVGRYGIAEQVKNLAHEKKIFLWKPRRSRPGNRFKHFGTPPV
jgi:hypothetical protein